MIRNFSQNAHRILTVFSQEEAARYGSVQVYPEHIFISILKFIGSESYRMLDILDIGVGSEELDAVAASDADAAAEGAL